ncbi:hypothetical protein NPIL_591091, partial [Nephila pilipes]
LFVIYIDRKAQKVLDDLDPMWQERARKSFEEMKVNPRHKAKKIRDKRCGADYRRREGDLRILFNIK